MGYWREDLYDQKGVGGEERVHRNRCTSKERQVVYMYMCIILIWC